MKKTIVLLLPILLLIGCYEMKIKKAYQELKIGSSKAEIERLFKPFKFIKEQTVQVYPNATESGTRGSIWGNNRYEDIQPGKKIVIDALTFDGNTKVFTYLVDLESHWPNAKTIYYVAIFYDKLNDKVIGKAIMAGLDDSKNWNDMF